jgi:hypothetical protein
MLALQLNADVSTSCKPERFSMVDIPACQDNLVVSDFHLALHFFDRMKKPLAVLGVHDLAIQTEPMRLNIAAYASEWRG